ncbi:mercury(II) reductase [Arthrobacter sp. ISL-72]|uniref:mercury(II) reductase n=1 Tax=Arthrobacter sp. ISL-72 TaxID=2819114 RepID=UPI001BEA8344|nr:mercury(II) reductase [Arthrobacter sp. ISL-72]MBT2597974.1 mercury(II) reductase [Arthrobacter sp. ISL-72]
MNTKSTNETFDLAIIGAGSAAKAAAMEARRQGRSVVMIERGHPGGTCLNVGCVPSKHLLAAAAARAGAHSSRFPGITSSAGPVDLASLIADKDAFISELRERDHVQGTAQAGITLRRGTASFSGADDTGVSLNLSSDDGQTGKITARHVLIATGAQPFVPPIPGIGTVDYLTSSTSMSIRELPATIIVVGANAISLEQAQLFSRLGTKVTVIEVADRIAPFEDPAISAALREALEAEDIEIMTAANLTQVQPDDAGILATVETSGTTIRIRAKRILIATGRRPVTDELELDTVGVTVGTRGEVIVDEHLRTSHPRIWAAGDVTGHPQFVYVAATQGTTAVSNAFGEEFCAMDYTVLPRVTFISPSVASVGLTPAIAAAAGQPFETRELPLAFVPRALINRKTSGVLKLISDPATGRLLGAHMVGEEAGEVITSATYALASGLTVQQLATTWAPFLTMAEALRIAAQMPPATQN